MENDRTAFTQVRQMWYLTVKAWFAEQNKSRAKKLTVILFKWMILKGVF